ncbi:LysR family transcriptional regulator [Sandaracinus amylolyticus]|uniref:LysR family transcriptional regulator n=1 Tax=Sandaracinus amylolyticus TaxID=927083 RepID=UPI001F3CBBCC|nr:LysR family transcriptional regulator [Sandaracinus amylolyticus]UJR81624.1 LysR family transcriptional regulator [Sandaracinus amylolyticus]
MELRHLRYFVAVAEEGNVGRAARRLHITQPPLSRQIHELEAEIGAPLFERVPRGVVLTAVGEELLRSARDVLASADRALDRARRVAKGEVGHLRVAFVDTATYDGVPIAIYRRFRQRFPGIALELLPSTSMGQWHALQEKRVDLGFLYHLPPADRGIASRAISRDEVVLAMPKGHPLSRCRSVSVKQLDGEPMVWFPRAISPAYQDAILGQCQAKGVTIRIVQEAITDSTVLSLVAGGMGMAFAVGATRHRKPPAVVTRPIRDLSMPLTVSVVWRRDDRSAAVRSFLQVVDEVVSSTRRRAAK